MQITGNWTFKFKLDLTQVLAIISSLLSIVAAALTITMLVGSSKASSEQQQPSPSPIVVTYEKAHSY